MIAAVFWLAVVGAFFDWRYIRRGGQRPTREERLYLAAALALCAATVALMFVRAGGGPAGGLAALLGSLVFGLYQLRRFFIRRSARKPLP